MKILFLTLQAKHTYIPLDLGYVKAYCEKFGYQHEIIIKTFSRKDNVFIFSNRIKKTNPDMIVFFVENLLSSQIFTLRWALKLFAILKNKNEKIKFYIQSYKIREEYSKKILFNYPQIDLIIRGEPEQTIKEILENKCLNSILGITYKENNKIYVNKNRLLIDNLDDLPSPYLTNAIDKRFYSETGYAFISTSRGCLFRCFYCFRNVRFSKLRTFSINRIADEIKYLRANNVNTVFIIDDCFITNQKRFEQLANRISEINKNKIRFSLMCRYEFLSKQNMELFKKMNVERIQIGLQTINLEILKKLNRNFDKKKFENMINYFKKLNIFTTVDLILGLPGDNLKSFKKSVDYLLKIKPGQIRIHRLFIHPDTYLNNNQKRFKIKLLYKRPDYSLPVTKNNYSFSFNDINKAISYVNSKRKDFNIIIPN